MTDKEIEQKALLLYPKYEYGFPIQENKHKREGYIQGARDMYEQMVKNAIECEVCQTMVDIFPLDSVEIFSDGLMLDKTKFKAGDKVKVIILPSDNELNK